MISSDQVMEALRKVPDPDLHRDIVALGFVKDLRIQDADVSFTLLLAAPFSPASIQMKQQAEAAVKSLPGVGRVLAQIKEAVPIAPQSPKPVLIPGVRNAIPIGSGKGGVGKSTVSANLALALARLGNRVGLLDADIYGPSIPPILGIEAGALPAQGERGLVPVEAYGVKVISSGFFTKPNQAMVWRGPMVSKLVDQFLGSVDWGELDYLIVDLPPGTGDVQLELCQRIPLTGAVVVSTPQDAALRVAEKSISMFRQLDIPILGLVENMSHFVCRHCGEREDIFDSGGTERAAARWNVPLLGTIPLATAIREASDNGRPIMAGDSETAALFRQIAGNLMERVRERRDIRIQAAAPPPMSGTAR